MSELKVKEEGPTFDDSIVFIDISSVCRLCLTTDNLTTLTKSEELDDFRASINMKLLLEDDFPKKICNDCYLLLSQTVHFLGQCRLTQGVLQGIVEVSQNPSKLEQQEYKEVLEGEDDNDTRSELCSSPRKEALTQSKNAKKCSTCGLVTLTMIKHRTESKKCRIKCEHCSFSHSSEATVQRHARTVHSDVYRQYCCPVCKKLFKYQHSLQRHVRVHTFGEQFECPTCFKRFTTKVGLQQHQNRHTGAKTMPCKLCDEKFANFQAKSAHMQKQHSHKESKHSEAGAFERKRKTPYLCSFCGKSYAKYASYYQHYTIHVMGKRFICDQCPFKTGLRGALITHQRVHTGERPYKCSFCPKSFKQQPHLQAHENLHKDIRQFACGFCQKRFAIKPNLVEHERRHSRKRPFQCHVCCQGFYSSSARKKHVATKHGEEEVENIKNHPWRCDSVQEENVLLTV